MKNKSIEDLGKKVYGDTNMLKDRNINHPFYENESKYFNNKNWATIKLENDFFIEKLNLPIILALTKYYKEKEFLICNAHSYGKIEFTLLPIDLDLIEYRKFLETEGLWFNDWYVMSINGDWAAVSIYDDDCLVVGFDNFLDSVKELAISNENYIQKY